MPGTWRDSPRLVRSSLLGSILGGPSNRELPQRANFPWLSCCPADQFLPTTQSKAMEDVHCRLGRLAQAGTC